MFKFVHIVVSLQQLLKEVSFVYINFYFKFLERLLTHLYLVSVIATKNNMELSFSFLWCILVHCLSGTVNSNSAFHYLFKEGRENFVLFRHAL